MRTLNRPLCFLYGQFYQMQYRDTEEGTLIKRCLLEIAGISPKERRLWKHTVKG